MYEYQAKVTNVVDGDTLDAAVDLGFKIITEQRFRLAHIDTPERGQQNFEQAKQFLADCCLGKTVKIRTSKVSKFGYYLIELLCDDGQSINSKLIDAGLAQKYEGGKK